MRFILFEHSLSITFQDDINFYWTQLFYFTGSKFDHLVQNIIFFTVKMDLKSRLWQAQKKLMSNRKKIKNYSYNIVLDNSSKGTLKKH
jgi:hypothetical protein